MWIVKVMIRMWSEWLSESYRFDTREEACEFIRLTRTRMIEKVENMDIWDYGFELINEAMTCNAG